MTSVLLSPPPLFTDEEMVQKFEQACLGVYAWGFPLVCPTAKSPSESQNSKDAVNLGGGGPPAKEKRQRE